MNTLVIDSTIAKTVLALVRDQKEVAKTLVEPAAENLISDIDKLFKANDIDLKSIDLFCVAVGPGSFTGLRIGLMAAKSLAFVTKKPVVGVPSLTALALGYFRKHVNVNEVTVLLPAGSRDLFMGAFVRDEKREIRSKADVKLVSALQIEVDTISASPVISYFDGWLDSFKKAGLAPIDVQAQEVSPLALSFLGKMALSEGNVIDFSAQPTYIKRSAAEDIHRADLDYRLPG